MDTLSSIFYYTGQFLGSVMPDFVRSMFPNVNGIYTIAESLGVTFSNVFSFMGSAIGQIYLGAFSILPDGGKLPLVFHQASQYFGNSLATINFIFPVSTLVYCMTLVFSIKVALWSLHIIRIVISFARGTQVDRYKFNN